MRYAGYFRQLLPCQITNLSWKMQNTDQTLAHATLLPPCTASSVAGYLDRSRAHARGKRASKLIYLQYKSIAISQRYNTLQDGAMCVEFEPSSQTQHRRFSACQAFRAA